MWKIQQGTFNTEKKASWKASSRSSKKTSMAGAEWVRKGVGDDGAREAGPACHVEACKIYQVLWILL